MGDKERGEYWSIGAMEYWSDAVMGKKECRNGFNGFALLQRSITPVLQVSIRRKN